MAEASKILYPLLFDLGENKSINFYYVLAPLRGELINILSLSHINKIYILLIKAASLLPSPPKKTHMERLLFNKILPILQITRSVETSCSPHKQSIIKHIVSHFTF